MKIDNIAIYGFDNSIKAAKYPMSVDVSDVGDKITPGIRKLAQCQLGTGHDNFLNGIVVQFDLQCSVKMWTEIQRYHFVDFVSSQSTMHRIAQFDLDSSYDKHTDPRMIEIMKELVERYNQTGENGDYLRCLYSNPCGMLLTARLTTNYRQLKTIYKQRRNHRLQEWREFCEWITRLPYSEFITEVKE